MVISIRISLITRPVPPLCCQPACLVGIHWRVCFTFLPCSSTLLAAAARSIRAWRQSQEIPVSRQRLIKSLHHLDGDSTSNNNTAKKIQLMMIALINIFGMNCLLPKPSQMQGEEEEELLPRMMTDILGMRNTYYLRQMYLYVNCFANQQYPSCTRWWIYLSLSLFLL